MNKSITHIKDGMLIFQSHLRDYMVINANLSDKNLFAYKLTLDYDGICFEHFELILFTKCYTLGKHSKQ
jgi:hypothetical protein